MNQHDTRHINNSTILVEPIQINSYLKPYFINIIVLQFLFQLYFHLPHKLLGFKPKCREYLNYFTLKIYKYFCLIHPINKQFLCKNVVACCGSSAMSVTDVIRKSVFIWKRKEGERERGCKELGKSVDQFKCMLQRICMT